MQRYTPSGVVPIGGGLLTIVGSFLTAAVLAFAYALIIWWVPFIYLNFLATLGFGFAMGIAVTVLASMGKIRSPLFVRFTWLATLLLGYYCYWAMSLWARGAWEAGLMVFDPRAVLAFGSILFEEGSWGFVKGANVTGWFLVAFWVAEFGILSWISYITAVANIDQPFCESCYEWTETENGVALYQASGTEPGWDRVRQGDFGALLEIPLLSASLSEYTRLDVNACPKCTASNFLSVVQVKKTVDKDGDETTNESPLFANLTLTGEQLAHVRALVDQAADAAAEAAAERSLAAEEAQQARGEDPSEFPKIKLD